jgi:hypothetical protein
MKFGRGMVLKSIIRHSQVQERDRDVLDLALVHLSCLVRGLTKAESAIGTFLGICIPRPDPAAQFKPTINLYAIGSAFQAQVIVGA